MEGTSEESLILKKIKAIHAVNGEIEARLRDFLAKGHKVLALAFPSWRLFLFFCIGY
jgi:hypothetical protein